MVEAEKAQTLSCLWREEETESLLFRNLAALEVDRPNFQLKPKMSYGILSMTLERGRTDNKASLT